MSLVQEMVGTTVTTSDRPAEDRLGGVALLLAVAAFGLGAIGFGLAADDGVVAAEVIRLGLVALWVVAGAVLVVREVQRRLGVVVLGGAALAGVCAFANGLAVAGINGTAESIAEFARPLALGLLPAAGLHLVLALPDGLLGTAGRRTAVKLAYLGGAALGLAIWPSRPSVPMWPVALAAIALVVLAAPAAHRRYLAAVGPVRQRMQWLGLAVALAAETVLVLAALELLVDWPNHAGEVMAAATVVVPLAFIAASSRRLVGRVDRILTHAVSISGLSAVVVAVYVLVVLGLGRTPTDDERSVLLLSMVAAAVCAVVFLPMRERLSETANRLVYGERRAPDEALQTFGSRLSRAIPLDELLLQLAESLHKSMTLRSSEVWTGSDGVLERAASVPDRGAVQITLGEKERPVVARAGVSGPAWASVWLPQVLEGRVAGAPLRIAPVTHSGEALGLIVVERREGDDDFTEEDERVLTELARQVGLALHNVQLDSALQASLDKVRRQAFELQESRARIVATADAERRKIERNLHDGAQQHLVALAVKLRLVQQVADADLQQAKTMLEEARAEVQETVEELRTLAHGIYPPLLMDRGLTEALRAAAGRAVLPVDVDAEGVERYPQELEAAVYFCCLEALQNAGKHAGEGAEVRLRVWEDAGSLRFEVADNGAGFDAGQIVSGAGFVNMADRLGAIGGTVEVTSARGSGTKVGGTIPLPRS